MPGQEIIFGFRFLILTPFEKSRKNDTSQVLWRIFPVNPDILVTDLILFRFLSWSGDRFPLWRTLHGLRFDIEFLGIDPGMVRWGGSIFPGHDLVVN